MQILWLLLFFLTSLPAYAQECWHGKKASFGQVVEVKNNGAMLLSDGRRLSLSNLLPPHRPERLPKHVPWPEWEAYTGAATKKVTGRNIAFFPVMFRGNRHGIIPAHVYVLNRGQRIWLQKLLVSKGLSRVESSYGDVQCLASLLKVEAKAREAALGIWKRQEYKPVSASDRTSLYRRLNSFTLVEGQIRNVAKIRGRVYLNFGSDWRRDFTVRISRRNWRSFEERGLSRDIYKGKKVRVRGWVVSRNGPLIEVAHPSLIELLETTVSTSKQ